MRRIWTRDTSRWILTALLVLLIGISISGCFPVWDRRLSWGGITAREEQAIGSGRITTFHQVYYQPENGERVFTIRMPDGSLVRSDEISRSTLDKYDPVIQENSEGEPDIVSVRYKLGNVTVYFHGDEIWEIFVSAWWARYEKSFSRSAASVPAIGDPEGQTVYSLPISESQLIELFGKPDKDQTGLFST